MSGAAWHAPDARACMTAFACCPAPTGIYRGVPVRLNPRQKALSHMFRTYVDVLHVQASRVFKYCDFDHACLRCIKLLSAVKWYSKH
jgi:hypothetical protein